MNVLSNSISSLFLLSSSLSLSLYFFFFLTFPSLPPSFHSFNLIPIFDLNKWMDWKNEMKRKNWNLDSWNGIGIMIMIMIWNGREPPQTCWYEHTYECINVIKKSGCLKHVACFDSRPELQIMEKQTLGPSFRSKAGCGMLVIDIFTAWKYSLTLISFIPWLGPGWPKVIRPVSVWKTTIASLFQMMVDPTPVLLVQDQSTNALTLVIKESLSDVRIHTLLTLIASGLILQTSRPDTTCSKYVSLNAVLSLSFFQFSPSHSFSFLSLSPSFSSSPLFITHHEVSLLLTSVTLPNTFLYHFASIPVPICHPTHTPRPSFLLLSPHVLLLFSIFYFFLCFVLSFSRLSLLPHPHVFSIFHVFFRILSPPNEFL